MTENITSLWVRSGSIAAINSSRKWHALPELMKYSKLRLILLLGILFIPALSANAETWEPITCINVNQDLRQSQTSDGNGLATITMQNGAWYYWEQKSKNPWDGLMHFTPTQDKDGKGYGVRFTIKAKDGYRITKVIFRDTEGNGTYRNDEGILRLSVEKTTIPRDGTKILWTIMWIHPRRGNIKITTTWSLRILMTTQFSLLHSSVTPIGGQISSSAV